MPSVSMRIPFIVPSLLTLAAMGCLVFIFGVSRHHVPYTGYVLFGYLVAMFSVAIAPTGWFRMAVYLSHSFVIGYLVAVGLTSAFLERWSSVLFLDMISIFPATALSIAVAIWIVEKGIRLSRFSERLDRR